MNAQAPEAAEPRPEIAELLAAIRTELGVADALFDKVERQLQELSRGHHNLRRRVGQLVDILDREVARG